MEEDVILKALKRAALGARERVHSGLENENATTTPSRTKKQRHEFDGGDSGKNW